MGCVGYTENITTFLKWEIHSAKEKTVMRDSLLKEKNLQDGMMNFYFEELRGNEYKNLTTKRLNLLLKQTDKIDCQIQR